MPLYKSIPLIGLLRGSYILQGKQLLPMARSTQKIISIIVSIFILSHGQMQRLGPLAAPRVTMAAPGTTLRSGIIYYSFYPRCKHFIVKLCTFSTSLAQANLDARHTVFNDQRTLPTFRRTSLNIS